jgi:hypothetical protein
VRFLAVVLLCAINAVAVGQIAPAKRALLIGVNEYRAVPSLQGSINDIETMREVLITRWGFAPGNITVVRDAQATRAGILSALQQLARQAQPNDTVYFHYSGHGSQVQDLNGDETDGLDETLVPHDGRTDRVPDIIDDELDAIFARLNARAAVIVLDSCHSGTATRALDIRSRSIPADKRLDLYRSDQDGEVRTRAIVPRMQSRYLVMSGAAANEEALDGPVDGRYHGFFTYSLSRSLMSQPANASARAVFAGVERELRRIQMQFGRASMPEPQLEAPPALVDQPLVSAADSSAANGARLASVPVQVLEGGRVRLLNGALLGAVPGTTWAIYPAAETAFTPSRALATATVLQANGNDAYAALRGNALIPNGARAVLALPASAAPRIPIRLGSGALGWRRQIEELFSRTVNGAQIVGDEQSARFLIDADQSGMKLLTADGLQVLGAFDPVSGQGAAEVARLMTHSGQAAELLAIDNAASQLRIAARVVGNTRPATRDIVLAADTRPTQLHIRRPGEMRSAQNSLQLEIMVNADAYLTIVDVGPDGAITLLFPNDYQNRDFWPEGRVRGNAPIVIPDSLAPGNRAGFYWDYSPPRGLDTVRIFASTDPGTANTIRQRIRGMQGQTGLQALRDDLQQFATRGIAVVSDPLPPDWTATTLHIAIND